MKRRDFLKQAAAMAAIGVGGCMAGGRGSRNAAATRGVVVSARDLSGAFDWPRLAHAAGLTTIATHIGPRDVMPFIMSGRGERFLDACARYGLQVEHELHAIDWLLPREMFASDPSFFRMNAKGERTPDSNCCPSNPFAIEVIACRAVEAARICRSTTGRHFFWMTDNGEKCNCRKCKGLSGAEQAVIVENAIVRALRAEIDPDATLAHLAYQFTMDPPRLVKPDPALFLEFAPIERWRAKGMQRREPLADGGPWLEKLDRLLEVFPSATSNTGLTPRSSRSGRSLSPRFRGTPPGRATRSPPTASAASATSRHLPSTWTTTTSPTSAPTPSPACANTAAFLPPQSSHLAAIVVKYAPP